MGLYIMMKGVLAIMRKLYFVAIFEDLEVIRAIITEDGLAILKSLGLAYTILKKLNNIFG